jgi:hypothetical protein
MLAWKGVGMVEMQTSATTLKISMEVPQKAKN